MYVYKHVCTGHTVYTLLAHVHVSCKHIMITQVCMWMSVWLHVMSRTDMHIIMYVQVVVLIHWGCSLEIWLKPEMLRAIYIYIYIYTHTVIYILGPGDLRPPPQREDLARRLRAVARPARAGL